jgi:HEPN domain-containing protein
LTARPDAADPHEWLRRARSNLERARVRTPNTCLEDACFDAQQSAEKSIKAVLIHLGKQFPYSHDLDRLLGVLQDSGVPVPSPVSNAGDLSQFAVATRYPGLSPSVMEEQWTEAVALAAAVLLWAEGVIAPA